MSENYKVIKGKIVTGGRTIEQIREANKGQGMSEEELENILKAYNSFNGAEALFRLWKIDEYESYYLIGCDMDFEEQIMLGMYYAEQCNPFQETYYNNLELFKSDWQAGVYDPQCAFALSENDIEIIQNITEAGEKE